MSERRFKEGLHWVESIVPKLHSAASSADDNLFQPYTYPYLDACGDCKYERFRANWKGRLGDRD